jgi:hypothetical protein
MLFKNSRIPLYEEPQKVPILWSIVYATYIYFLIYKKKIKFTYKCNWKEYLFIVQSINITLPGSIAKVNDLH